MAMISGDKVCINLMEKMGSSWLLNLYGRDRQMQHLNELNGRKLVVFIRHPYSKWLGGMKEEFNMMCPGVGDLSTLTAMFPEYDTTVFSEFTKRLGEGSFENLDEILETLNDDIVLEFGVKLCQRLFNITETIFPIKQEHSMFWKYTNEYIDTEFHCDTCQEQGYSLWELESMSDIYFADIKQMSNMNFVKWLIRLDPSWKDLIERSEQDKAWNIKANVTDDNFWPQISNLIKVANIKKGYEAYFDPVVENDDDCKFLTKLKVQNLYLRTIYLDTLRAYNYIVKYSNKYKEDFSIKYPKKFDEVIDENIRN